MTTTLTPVVGVITVIMVLMLISLAVALTMQAGASQQVKVLGIIDGVPGSGKTTICLFMGKVVKVVAKDIDDFTQPIVNPGHPTAETEEGIDRRKRFFAENEFTIQAIIPFLKKEVSDYIASVPDDTYIVFCGLSNIDELSIMPDYLVNTPQYLLKPDKKTRANRLVLRALEIDYNDGVLTCENFQNTYDNYVRFAIHQYSSMGVSEYRLTSAHGDEILRAVLMNAPDLGKDEIDKAVSAYRMQPSVKERLVELAKKVDCNPLKM